MSSLVQARRKVSEAGTPIHHPIKGLHNLGAEIRRGQVTLIAAGPGAGKTLLVQTLLTVGDGKGNKNSVLFCSSDTPANLIFQRAGALACSYTQDDVEHYVEAGTFSHIEKAVAEQTSHISWSFRSKMSIDYLVSLINAQVAIHDAYPEVLVIDILRDLSSEDDPDEWRALEDALVALRDIAAETGAAVIAVHHVGGAHEAGDQPIPLSGIRGKVGKTPGMILTLHRVDDTLRCSIVKNRTGQSSADGRLFAQIRADFGRMQFTG